MTLEPRHLLRGGLLLIGASATQLGLAQQGGAFAMRFSETAERRFSPARGSWSREGGEWLQAKLGAFDLANFAPGFLSGDYRISVEIKHEKGSLGAGLIFHSERPAGPTHAEMVRFESGTSLLQGHFLRGEFVCLEVIRFADKLPRPIERGSWVELALDIRGDRREVDVSVNGTLVAKSCRLQFRCGRLALQASNCRARFRRLEARGRSSPMRWPAWPRSARVVNGRLELHSPAAGTVHAFADPDAEPELLEGDRGVFRSPERPAELLRQEPELRDSLADGGRVYLALPAMVRIRPSSGPSRAFRPEGAFDPVALVPWRNKVWAVDLAGSRLVEVPPCGDPRIVVDYPSEGTARVRALAGSVAVFEKELAGLRAGQSFELVMPELYRTMPRSRARRTVEFMTPPARGWMRARRLRLLVLIYGNVFERSVLEKPGKAELELWPLSEYARIEGEIEAARRWYWINSGFRLLLEPRYHRIPDVISAGMIAEGGKPNGCPAARELAKRAREAGVDLRRVQGVIVVEAYRKWQEQRWRMVGNGGGLTLGAHGRGYGISWWFAPEKPGMSSWLMCHEFHHQLDALFEISGHAEYWFNHFSPTIGTSADFGEHWDGNAYILRSWPEHLWDSLDLGDAILLGDRDGDGFPDEDDRVPFDEKSFGSSPESRDSDGDGLSDREEVLQSSWVRQSGFETYGGKPVWPNPRSADSDRDGIHDAEDPLPLYRVNPELPAQGFRLLRQLEDEELDGALEIEMGLLGWKGERPELALRLRGLSPSDAVWTRALLDLGGDGWFTGPGNLSVTVHSSGTSPGVRVLNAALPGRWPTDDPRLAARAGVVVERQRGELVIRVPFRKGLGFVASPGHRFGLDLMVSTVKSRASGRGWLTIFEPHDLVAFRLPKTRRARLR